MRSALLIGSRNGGVALSRGSSCWAMEAWQCRAITKVLNQHGGGIDKLSVMENRYGCVCHSVWRDLEGVVVRFGGGGGEIWRGVWRDLEGCQCVARFGGGCGEIWRGVWRNCKVILISILLQVVLGLYMANMFKSMKGASKQLEADLIIAGHPIMFPSEPKATKKEWDLLQELDYRTLLCTHVHNGNAAAWNTAIAAIYADVDDVPQLLSSLENTKCTIRPNTEAKVLLMPSQALLKAILHDTPDISDAEMIEQVINAGRVYVRYFMREILTDDMGEGYDLDTAE